MQPVLTLDFVSDISCPWCAIGLSTLLTALERLPPQLAVALQNPETFKQRIAGLALLTSDAAPGGQIDLMDPRVPAWLAAFDLTLEAVRAKMEESAEAQAEQEVTNVQSE